MKKHNPIRRSALISITVCLCILLMAACGNEQQTVESDDNKNVSEHISIGTHQPGVAFHTAGSGIASVISDNSSIKTTVKPFSGSMTWMPLLNMGEVDLGVGEYNTVRWSFEGNEHLGIDEHKHVRTLVMGNKSVYCGLMVREDSGINSLSDLKGKRVTSDYTGDYGTADQAEAQLSSVGLTWDDVQRVPVSDVPSGLEALREGKADAAFVGVPTAGLNVELDNAIGLRALNFGDITPDEFDSFPQELRDEMYSFSPGLEPIVYKGGIVKEETVLYQQPIVLAASENLSEEIAYEAVKTLWDSYEELHPIFEWLETWTPETMFDPNPPAPYHSGAIKFFKEQGIWSDEAEQYHKELMQ